MRLRPGLLLLALLAAPAAGLAADPFAGDYATAESGSAVLRITREAGGYRLALLEHGRWSRPQPLQPLGDRTLEELFEPGWRRCVKGGLAAGVVGVFRTVRGSSCNGLHFPSEYYLLRYPYRGALFRVP